MAKPTQAALKTRAAVMALAALAVSVLAGGCGGSGGSSAPAALAPTPSPTPVPTPSAAPPPDPAVLVSGASPFPAGCSAGQTGTLYLDAEVEPYLAVNPTNPANRIGVWQQDRWSNGGSQGLMTVVTQDGGATWTRSAVPFSRCAGGNAANGGDYERASDPWVTFSPNGVAFQMALSISGAAQTATGVSAMLVSRSSDGGRTWGPITTLIRDAGAQFFNDKNSITADSTNPNFAYAVWDRLDSSGRGPTLLARTVDGGATWEAARIIYDPGLNAQTLGNQIVTLPDGTVLNIFAQFNPGPNNSQLVSLQLIRSTDKGATWSGPVKIADVTALGARDPENSSATVRDGATLPGMAVAPNGHVYVVWQDVRASGAGVDGILLTRSTDGGNTWSTPVRVNSVTTVAAFTPSVHVRADGTVGVTYYDFRSNTSDPTTLFTDKWLARSSDGGATWNEVRVAAPFDLVKAPIARGYFLGDYHGLASVGTAFIPFYVRTNDDVTNRNDVFTTAPVTGAVSVLQKQADDVQRLKQEATLPRYAAQAAKPLVVTPALRQRLDETARAVRQARLSGQGNE
ncbi:MAG: sialidase family protein [Burkholderiaceae bacterium]